MSTRDGLIAAVKEIKESAKKLPAERSAAAVSLVDACVAVEINTQTERDSELINLGYRLAREQHRAFWDSYYSALKSYEASSRGKREPTSPATIALLSLIGRGLTNEQILQELAGGSEVGPITVYDRTDRFVFENESPNKGQKEVAEIAMASLAPSISRLRRKN